MEIYVQNKHKIIKTVWSTSKIQGRCAVGTVWSDNIRVTRYGQNWENKRIRAGERCWIEYRWVQWIDGNKSDSPHLCGRPLVFCREIDVVNVKTRIWILISKHIIRVSVHQYTVTGRAPAAARGQPAASHVDWHRGFVSPGDCHVYPHLDETPDTNSICKYGIPQPYPNHEGRSYT